MELAVDHEKENINNISFDYAWYQVKLIFEYKILFQMYAINFQK